MARSLFQQDDEIRDLARRVIEIRPEVAHVELDSVLFLRDLQGGEKGVKAKCYSFADHPIGFFTDHPFCIVVYEQETFYFSAEQLALLILHELMHIPLRGSKLVDHNRKDFARILDIGGVYWASPGEEIPDILGGIL